MKSLLLLSLLVCPVLTLPAASAQATPHDTLYTTPIPVGGNSWVLNNPALTNAMISDSGITGWTDPGVVVRTFFRPENTGEISIGIRARLTRGHSILKVTFGNSSRQIELSNTDFKTLSVGNFIVGNPGYQWIDIQGLDKSAPTFAEVTDLVIGGPVTTGKVCFVKDEFYWGRRGPSVHLNYSTPATEEDIRWFYNEVTVPRGGDVMGSFFMTNGFAEGYLGIQVNSPVERRILFSVWSPYQADDPDKVPDDQKVKLLRKGENVYAGTFGNEGSGGQSYRIYKWKSGVTYRLLLKGEPSESNSTDYTAYFFSPESHAWELIASFRRPKTTTGLKRLHSFLENFLPETGQKSRKALFANQWVRTVGGQWFEMTSATLTADATAKKGARLDFQGGVENGRFFLKNCGFFDGTSTIGGLLNRRATGKAPDVDGRALR